MIATGSVLALHPAAGNCPYAVIEVDLALLGADDFGDPLRGKRGKRVCPLNSLGRIGCACAFEYGAKLSKRRNSGIVSSILAMLGLGYWQRVALEGSQQDPVIQDAVKSYLELF